MILQQISGKKRSQRAGLQVPRCCGRRGPSCFVRDTGVTPALDPPRGSVTRTHTRPSPSGAQDSGTPPARWASEGRSRSVIHVTRSVVSIPASETALGLEGLKTTATCLVLGPVGQQCSWAQRGSAPTGLFWDHMPGHGHRAERVVAGRSRGPWLESWPHPPGGWCTCLHVAASALPGRPAKGQQGLPRPSPRVPATAFCQPDQVARPAQAPGVGRRPPALMRTGGHFKCPVLTRMLASASSATPSLPARPLRLPSKRRALGATALDDLD